MAPMLPMAPSHTSTAVIQNWVYSLRM